MTARRVFIGVASMAAVALAIVPTGLGAVSANSDQKAAGPPATSTASAADVSCNQFMPPKQMVAGKSVGPEDCRMQPEKTVVDASWPDVDRVLGQGRKYQRADMGISGTLAGYVVKNGPRQVEFTTAPEFVFPQAGNKTTPVRATVRYEAMKGSSMTILYPADPSGWNGKLWVSVHGMGRSFREGSMKSWDKQFDPAKPTGDIHKFEKVMLAKGYTVAIHRRNSYATQGLDGDYSVTLDDGTVLEGRNTGEAPELIYHFTSLARNYIKDKLGRTPSRIYWYGKSGGARLGRLVSFQGTNLDEHGKPLFDGILVDDSGAGLWLPIVMKDGKNVVFENKAVKDRFVKTIEVAHLAYNKERNDPVPDYVSPNFLANKRTTAQIVRANGLGDKYRIYEVRQVSHAGGETLPEGGRGDQQILPLWILMDAYIDMLDAWADKGVAPPPDKADFAPLGDANGDGVIENPGISVPEVACPTGVYYQFPPSSGLTGDGTTGFTPFDGKDLEPFDGRTIVGDPTQLYYTQAVFVDMNLNGTRDNKETVTEAWRRLGLLKPGESFSRQKYVDCVKKSVTSLQSDRMLTPKVAAYYLEQAEKAPFPAWVR